MSNKPLLLGKCKISFHHEYIAEHKLCKEKNAQTKERSIITKVVSTPKATRVLIETDKGEKITGRVVCSPRDMFTFETGRKLALRRAFSKPSSLSKEDRRRVWDEYNKLKPGGRW
jgi:hypothetical protein